MNTNIGIQAIQSSVMERLDVGGAEIEYLVQGKGEPVLLIPPAVTIDGLGLPLLAQPELASLYQLIHYHRRGYMGSTLGAKPLTFALQASDAAALLRHLGVKAAHVAGHSMGAGMALQLAVDAPDFVHSLALLEPNLQSASSGREQMDRLFQPVINLYLSGNKQAAIDTLGDALFGPNWQSIVEQTIPGAVEQSVRDADIFFKELRDNQAWQFGPQEAAAIHQPVLSVLGERSTPFMKKGRELIHAWFPQAEDLDVPTTHLLQLQDPQAVAHGLAEFFARHPMS